MTGDSEARFSVNTFDVDQRGCGNWHGAEGASGAKPDLLNRIDRGQANGARSG
jgi:hypothetical protein